MSGAKFPTIHLTVFSSELLQPVESHYKECRAKPSNKKSVLDVCSLFDFVEIGVDVGLEVDSGVGEDDVVGNATFSSSGRLFILSRIIAMS